MPLGNGQIDPSGVALATLMGEHTPLLHSILAELRAGTLEIGVSDAYGRELVLDKFPVTGCKRVLANRTGNGFSSLTVPTAPGTLVLAANEARLGCRITNTGANAVILYLADSARSGAACVSLAAALTWDGLIGQTVWCGNVWAVASTGTSTLVGGEV